MAIDVGSEVHPRYKGTAKWEVVAMAELPKPIGYTDLIQGKVKYSPRIVRLKAPGHGRVLWFAYWIATSKTQGKAKWGQGPPMLEESTLLELLQDAVAKGFFSKRFMKDLRAVLDAAEA